MNRVPPELINYENQMDDFLSEHRRKNLRVVNPKCNQCHTEGCLGECQANSFTGSLNCLQSQRTDEELRKLWMDAHIAAFAPPKPKKPKLWKLVCEYILRMVR